MINKLKSKVKNYPKIYSVLRKGHFLKEYLKLSVIRFFSIMFFTLPIKENKIIICNYFGKGYGDNGKYIAEEIIKEGLNCDIVWMLKKELIKDAELPNKIRTVRYKSVKALYEMSTAEFWIDNSRKEFSPIKRKGQYYIQTWHGGLGIKKIEGDVIDSLSKSYIRLAKKDSEMADLFISNSTHLTNIYKRAFWYEGNILECGYPKNDIFFKENGDIKTKIKECFNLETNIKIILYAPTFRSNNDMRSYNINYSKLIKTLEDKTNEKWVVLIRLHPNLIGYDNNIQYSDKVINATHYPDMQELVIGCDALISDYSSCMFDSEMMKIPTFIYASDLEEYMKDRGSYFDFGELPFPLATNNEELMINIINFDRAKYEQDVDSFNNKVGLKDTGDAARQIVDVIIKVSKEK